MPQEPRVRRTLPRNWPKTLIVGCGGIGGVVATSLHRRKLAFQIATTNQEVRECWVSSSPNLGGKEVGPPLKPWRVTAHCPTTKDFDLAIIAVQPPQIDEVARALRQSLRPGAEVVCLSNGLCECRLKELLPQNKILGAVVTWGARMSTPGFYTKTSRGNFILGSLEADPALRKTLEQTAAWQVLSEVAPVVFTKNLHGARFSKLTLNCAVSTLGTIGGTTLGRLLARREARRLGMAIMSEAVSVAQKQKIRLEKVAGIDLEYLFRSTKQGRRLNNATQHALLWAIGNRYRKLRSSMLAAMERGRQPAVNFLNGEVVAQGEKLGIPTPFNEAARQVVWEIFNGETEPGEEALRRVEMISQKLIQKNEVLNSAL
ncbi:MAG: 2-dehydropantoate 2-reductase [Polyangiaceae bacterium]|nr:2-dehydropantoate 2-reductase [Polyangiaceae bacterium]